jgi:hypothetical protein
VIRDSGLWLMGLAVVVLVGVISPAGAQQWTPLGTIAEGTQFDAARGPQDEIHLISSKYYQLDRDGNVSLSEDVGDGHQGDLDFPPAIAVGSDGSVHIVTRHDGDYEGGNDIRYRRREAGGSWDRDYYVGSRERRNYVVSVATVGGPVYVSYTVAGDNVWGDVRLWEAGASSATSLGDIGGIWRGDNGTRMRANHERVFLVSGVPDPGGTAYLLHAEPGSGIVGEMVAHTNSHTAGSDRRGFSDVVVDGTGHAHFTYGAYQTVHYNRYDEQGQRVYGSDIQIADGLGDWHMSTGLSAVGASDDGLTVVAVMLRANGTQQASDSDLLTATSLDGGATWSAAEDTGLNTDGGEGRLLPRIVAVGNHFCLFYRDADSGSISLATMFVQRDADGDGFDSEEDCDDDNAHVYPGADEHCSDGVDNDCDGFVDGDDEECGGTGDDDDAEGDDDDLADDDDDDSAVPGDDDDAGGGGCECSSAARPNSTGAALCVALIALHVGRRRSKR